MRTDILIAPGHDDLTSFVKGLPHGFEAGGEVIYHGRNDVRAFDVGGRRLVVKRYKRPNFVQRLSCSLGRSSKARRAYLYAARLLELGIDTPRPIATLDVYHGLMYRQGYFVSTEDTRPSCAVLRKGGFADKDALMQALAEYLVMLHRRGFLHGDTNLSNFLYEPVADGSGASFGPAGHRYRFAVIDVNRSAFVEPEGDERPTRSQCLRNLVRLTHVREVLKVVVTAYARIRGWDEGVAYGEVEAHLRHFEMRRAARRRVAFRR